MVTRDRRNNFPVRPATAGLSILLFNLLLAGAPSMAQVGTPVPSVQAIVTGMARARTENRASFRPYVVTRSYQLFGSERDKLKSQVIADITFVPPNRKDYAIEKSSGAGLGERAVRRILQSEAEAAKDYDATDYSLSNYAFRYVRTEQDVRGQRSYVLALLPKREDKNLLRGEIWVDEATFRVHRVEAGLAKSTSWWIRDVHIVLLYADVNGMWLQTGMEATARVRLLGPHRMVSNDLKYQMDPVVAMSDPKRSSSPYLAAAGKLSENHGRPDRLRDWVIRKESSLWNSTMAFGWQ